METQTPVASSPTPEAALEIPRSGTTEYAEWRVSGTLPEKKVEPKAAPATAEEQDSVVPADSAATTTQEKPNKRRPDIEERFKQYSDKIDRLERELEEARKPKETKAEPSPARQEQPQTYADYRKAFKPTDWITKFAEQNPQASYEEATAAMADHLADARDYFRGIEQRAAEEKRTVDEGMAQARERYANFDEIKERFLDKTFKGKIPLIPTAVLKFVNKSKDLVDVIYTLAENEQDFNEFIALAKKDEDEAIQYVADIKRGVAATLAKSRDNKGKFIAEEREEEKPVTPAKRGPESAPAPPLEVGSRGSGTMDESERAFQAIERGDANAVRAFMKAENAKDLRRRRGV